MFCFCNIKYIERITTLMACVTRQINRKKRKKELDSLKCVCTFISYNYASQRRHKSVVNYAKAKKRGWSSFCVVVAAPPKHLRVFSLYFFIDYFQLQSRRVWTTEKAVIIYENYTWIFLLTMVDMFYCIFIDNDT